MKRVVAVLTAAMCLMAVRMAAQDPTGVIEGLVSDKSGSSLSDAQVTAKNLTTGFTKRGLTDSNGLFRLSLLPVGRYSITVEAAHFAKLVQQPLTVNVSETVRVKLPLEVATVQSVMNVTSEAPLVDTSTNTVGAVVTGREILELPLNGRNFTQLGLLQAGAAPLPSGLITAGGPMRQGQTYEVNGTRPEQNMYLIDG
ncbi:MAG TPA: carboxypeptidase-like regulatory domain-containing protein, partial [Bryobacteraceae bacterium]